MMRRSSYKTEAVQCFLLNQRVMLCMSSSIMFFKVCMLYAYLHVREITPKEKKETPLYINFFCLEIIYSFLYKVHMNLKQFCSFVRIAL